MRPENRKIKVLMAKTALDGHWRGVYVVSRAMRDAGMEVVYGGDLNPYEIVEAAVQEAVDVVGLNIGGRYYQVGIIIEKLKEKGIDDVLIVAGGTIPPEDIPVLKDMGVHEVFPPGSSLESITSYIKEHVT